MFRFNPDSSKAVFGAVLFTLALVIIYVILCKDTSIIEVH